MRVALLGTGKMGAAIARRVAAAGHDLTLWNRTRARAEAVGVGVVSDTPSQAVAGREVVLSILFGPESVRETYRELTPEPGQVYCEMSTAGPDLPGEIAPLVEERKAELLACPILGSIGAIDSGSATLLAGGDEHAVDKALPVLRTFSEPQYAGSREQAAALKLINNAMLGVAMAAAAELLNAAERQGLDLDRVFDRLSGMVPVLNARRRGLLGRDHSNPTFDVMGACKDLDLALSAAHVRAAPLPVTAAARELFELAKRRHAVHEMSAVREIFGE